MRLYAPPRRPSVTDTFADLVVLAVFAAVFGYGVWRMIAAAWALM